jgi:hypothetical protein
MIRPAQDEIKAGSFPSGPVIDESFLSTSNGFHFDKITEPAANVINRLV